MESPSSARRVTRSQSKGFSSSASNNIHFSKKGEESESLMSKSTQRNLNQDRSVLIDITNDSPIVGLAMGSKLKEETPLSSVAKRRRNLVPKNNNTPGSGEALLRGQVKTLLQKVEEEEVAMISKFSLDSHGEEDNRQPFLPLKKFLNTPHMGRLFLAPTPANTPQVSGGVLENGSHDRILDASVIGFPTIEQLKISEVVNELFEGKTAENVESDKYLITRSLLLDFSDKSDISTVESSGSSSSTICQETESIKDKSLVSSLPDDDDSSIWSIQVNASSTRDDDEVEQEDEDDDDDEEEESYDDDYDYEEEDEDGVVDQLCEGMSRISVQCTGKHTRFVYNSDDEIIGEEEDESDVGEEVFKDEVIGEEEEETSDVVEFKDDEVVKLKGLPTPKGKHFRFKVDDDE